MYHFFRSILIWFFFLNTHSICSLLYIFIFSCFSKYHTENCMWNGKLETNFRLFCWFVYLLSFVLFPPYLLMLIKFFFSLSFCTLLYLHNISHTYICHIIQIILLSFFIHLWNLIHIHVVFTFFFLSLFSVSFLFQISITYLSHTEPSNIMQFRCWCYIWWINSTWPATW